MEWEEPVSVAVAVGPGEELRDEDHLEQHEAAEYDPDDPLRKSSSSASITDISGVSVTLADEVDGLVLLVVAIKYEY